MLAEEVVGKFHKQVRCDISENRSIRVLELHEDVRMSKEFDLLSKILRGLWRLRLPKTFLDLHCARFVYRGTQRFLVLVVLRHELD